MAELLITDPDGRVMFRLDGDGCFIAEPIEMTWPPERDDDDAHHR